MYILPLILSRSTSSDYSDIIRDLLFNYQTYVYFLATEIGFDFIHLS